MTLPHGLLGKCNAQNHLRCSGPSNFIDVADIPLAANHGVVRAVLVDPRAKPGRAHGERHSVIVAPT
jgi:hypothetical protein